MNSMPRLNVNLPSELHAEAKVEAVYARQTLAEFVTEAIRARVEESKRRRATEEKGKKK